MFPFLFPHFWSSYFNKSFSKRYIQIYIIYCTISITVSTRFTEWPFVISHIHSAFDKNVDFDFDIQHTKYVRLHL